MDYKSQMMAYQREKAYMKYPLASKTWDEAEYQAVMKVFGGDYYKMGSYCKQFEKAYAEWAGTNYAVFCNSGSSANLLAIAALRHDPRFLTDKRDEIIVPAVSWSTTYYPVMQLGYKPIFVDICDKTFNIQIEDLEKKITPNTRAIFTVNLLGNPCDFGALKRLCEQHNLVLLEDNCESMGASYHGKKTGSHGLIGTQSTFFSHHICTMEGGICVTDDELTYELLKSLRAHGWIRDVENEALFYTYFEKPESELYEHFHFVLPGYNFRPTEIQGALGLEQLKKLDGFINERIINAEYFQNTMLKLNSGLQFQQEQEDGQSSWFWFGLLCEHKEQRDVLARILKKQGVDCRPIVSGNMLRQPIFSNLAQPEKFPNAQKIHDCGLAIGNHHYDAQKEIDYFTQVFQSHILTTEVS